MLDLAITAIGSFALGWGLHWIRSRGRLKALGTTCEARIRSAEEQLALDRLRMEQRYQEAVQHGGRSSIPEHLPTLDMYRDGHLARPRSAATDSPTSRA